MDPIHFTLEYAKYPVHMAYQILRSDLSKARSKHHLRMIENRWKLALARFETEMRRVPGIPNLSGTLSSVDEYASYLISAKQLLHDRAAALKGVR